MRFRNEIDIQLSPEAVFGFVVDQTNNPKWNYYVTHVTQEQGETPGLGARYQVTRKTDQQLVAITAFCRDDNFIVETVQGRPVFRRHIRFLPIENGTRLIDTWDLRTSFPGLLEIFAVRRVRKAVNANLNILKLLLETGAARLQDGRLSSLPSSETPDEIH